MTWWDFRCGYRTTRGTWCSNWATHVAITGEDVDDRVLACGLHTRTRGTAMGRDVKRLAR